MSPISEIGGSLFKDGRYTELGFEEACLDMGPHESLVNSIDHLHMGRSEALLTSDSREGIPGRTNRKHRLVHISKIAFGQEISGTEG